MPPFVPAPQRHASQACSSTAAHLWRQGQTPKNNPDLIRIVVTGTWEIWTGSGRGILGYTCMYPNDVSHTHTPLSAWATSCGYRSVCGVDFSHTYARVGPDKGVDHDRHLHALARHLRVHR